MASELGIMPFVKDKNAKCCICGGKKQLRHAVGEKILCIDCNATNGLFGAWLEYESARKFLTLAVLNTVVMSLCVILHSTAYVFSPINSVRANLHYCIAIFSMFCFYYFCKNFFQKIQEKKESRNKMFLLRLAGPSEKTLRFLDIGEERKLVKQIYNFNQSVINKSKRRISTAKGNMP